MSLESLLELENCNRWKRSQLAIRGILIDENWTDSPNLVKSEFLSHFKKRFDQPQETRLQLDMNFLKILNSDQQADLECEVTKDEKKGQYGIVGLINPLGPNVTPPDTYSVQGPFVELKQVIPLTGLFIHLEGRISTAGYEVSTAGYEVSTASFILSTAYEYLVLFSIH
ncbi:hypothetical protein Tco_0771331 [Tanacetum coccineum]|uniref:Uncharacterized protein n=1 Tax=Tanacetum coccineum TaxID=301880 RepID=A0ABQ4ZEZ8_9ASTR